MNKLDSLLDAIINEGYTHSWKGFDPYDFASSKIRLPKKIRAKLSFINKISPINFRGLLGIKESDNVKSDALFLNAICLSSKRSDSKVESLKRKILSAKSNEFDEFSLGFAFEMSLTRYSSGPGKTSLIISLYGVFALFELWKKEKSNILKEAIFSFKRLLDKRWLKYEDDTKLWYSYQPNVQDEVYNATAKVGRFYAQFYLNFPEEGHLPQKITKILSYLLSKQNVDGSWYYSETYRYSDNFHTAFILESIYEMHKVTMPAWSKDMFESGMRDYKKSFFDKANRPIHFHPLYEPKDIRSFILKREIRDYANAIILFSKTNNLQIANTVLDHALGDLYLVKHNYFGFYMNGLYRSQIKYIRWQGWMALAIAVYLDKVDSNG